LGSTIELLEPTSLGLLLTIGPDEGEQGVFSNSEEVMDRDDFCFPVPRAFLVTTFFAFGPWLLPLLLLVHPSSFFLVVVAVVPAMFHVLVVVVVVVAIIMGDDVAVLMAAVVGLAKKDPRVIC
jgi:hypothetical protein